MTSSRTTPPSSDEVEISVFGRGVGECIVIHLGDARWMIVDSCMGESGAAPLEYLKEMGVSGDAVDLIVASHWHDDHTRGLSEIVGACKNAKVAASDALQCEEFKTLLRASTQPFMDQSGASEMCKLYQVLVARRREKLANASITWCLADRTILRRSDVDVEALSPSDTTVSIAREELAKLIPSESSPKNGFVSQSANQVSVVLALRLGAIEVLLGSDLEGRAGRTTGWEAILSSEGRRRAKAHIYKVAHHGSPNGDSPAIWTEMMQPDPIAVLTPFNAGRTPRPQPDDISRILTKTRHLYQAGSAPGASRGRAKAVERTVREVAPDLRPLESAKLGHVRLRAYRKDAGNIRTDLFGRTANHSSKD